MPEAGVGDILEKAYACYHNPTIISPDPLETVLEFESAADREVAGLLAAALALGRAKAIVEAARRLFGLLGGKDGGGLASGIDGFRSRRGIEAALAGFKYRFFTAGDVAGLAWGIARARRLHGGLEALFRAGMAGGEGGRGGDEKFPPLVHACSRFVGALGELGGGFPPLLLPDPLRGSAGKRLFLYLRWMLRDDGIDPGVWSCVDPASLVVPLDTHVHKTARALGLTARKAADLKAALEVTEALRRYSPDDPLRYDYALTRIGIRRELSLEAFLASCR